MASAADEVRVRSAKALDLPGKEGTALNTRGTMAPWT